MVNRHAFCRIHLREVMKVVRKHLAKEEIKEGYAHISPSFKDTWEFWGPGSFYTHGSGCCKWYAKAEGWMAYLRDKNIDFTFEDEEDIDITC